jgi:hypothetical protein
VVRAWQAFHAWAVARLGTSRIGALFLGFCRLISTANRPEPTLPLRSQRQTTPSNVFISTPRSTMRPTQYLLGGGGGAPIGTHGKSVSR